MEFDQGWILLGLPMAFALGWLASRFDLRQLKLDNQRTPKAYFKGLNHLLNEQQDQAIDAFIEAVQNDPHAQLVGALAWSVLALSLGASSLLYMMIQRGAAAAVTSLMYLVPPSTAFMAWLLFDEAVTGMTILGTLCTVMGVVLVVKYPAASPVSRA